jgi:di/tricarboxylate transporter
MPLLATLLAIAVVLFVSEAYSADQVAIMVMAALIVTGLVPLKEGLAGFSSTATITVGAFFVITMAIRKTGALAYLTQKLTERVGNRPRVLLAAIIGMSALSSTFLHATGVVAVYMPVVIEAARKLKQSPSKYLIPLSYAAQFGGVCTLLGTTSNLVVSGVMTDHRMRPIGMFELTPLGLTLLAVGATYLLLLGWRLIPARRSEDELGAAYGLDPYLTELVVSPTSSVAHKSLSDAGLRDAGICVLEILRGPERLWNPVAQTVIEPGDVLVAKVTLPDMIDAYQRLGLELPPDVHVREDLLEPREARLVEVVLSANARILGKTIRQVRFAERYGVSVLAIKRRSQIRMTDLRKVRLRENDTLLVQGVREAIDDMARHAGFIILSHVDTPRMRKRQLFVVGAVMAGVVIATASHRVDVTVAALTGAAVLLAARVLKTQEAYDAVHWKVIFLIVGMVPLGTAMERTGMAAYLAAVIKTQLSAHPQMLLSGVFLVTMVVTSFVTHVATAMLMTPLVLSLAAATGLDPRPFCVAVIFAADTSFSTPVGYQTNAMIYGPGGYKFRDFIKVGVPLNLIFWGICSWMIPRLWPLH